MSVLAIYTQEYRKKCIFFYKNTQIILIFMNIILYLWAKYKPISAKFYNFAQMTKYNIREKREKDAAYRHLLSPALANDLKERIIDIIVKQKKYKDKDYSARQLAADLSTNTRYISAVVNLKFQMNYSSYVNKYRIKEAMTMLKNPRYKSYSMEEISSMVGFSNRQSFYAAFYKINQMSPRDYKITELELLKESTPPLGDEPVPGDGSVS